jgi:hypothetical protein
LPRLLLPSSSLEERERFVLLRDEGDRDLERCERLLLRDL